MTVAVTSPDSTSNGAQRLRWDVVNRRLEELGVPDDDTARADKLGVTRMTIQRWKHGWTGVSLRQARRVSQIIGVQVDHLIDAGDDGRPQPPPPQPPRPSGPPGRGADQ